MYRMQEAAKSSKTPRRSRIVHAAYQPAWPLSRMGLASWLANTNMSGLVLEPIVAQNKNGAPVV